MFQLAEINHMVRVPPWVFGESLYDAVVKELNRKLANKVIPNVGLCIALFDITSMDDSYIFPGDGASHTRVKFQYVVFRPFMEEIIEGIIKSADQEKIQVSLDFFEDIYIKADAMMTNMRYDETESAWVWEYQSNDETHLLYLDVGEKIRFKVISECFTDTTPSGPAGVENDTSAGKIPFIVYGSINDQGLGLVSWWTSANENS